MRRSTIALLLAFLMLSWVLACSNGEYPNDADSDSDGLSDTVEIFVTGTDPSNPDSDGDGVIDSAEGTLMVQIENLIPPGDGGPCAPYVQRAETIKIFLPTGPPGGTGIPYNSKSATYPLNLGTGCGLGIQVNFWYWTQHPDNPIGSGPPQNPDNSGANFMLNADCTFTKKPPCAGDGKETYVIADVTSVMQGGVCVVTIKPNRYTGCVTPACCSPYDGMGKCSNVTPRTYACPDPPP